MTPEHLTLSRPKLETYLACQRRFQLRYLQHLPWPDTPQTEAEEQVRQRGELFHQLVERHYLGFPPPADLAQEADPEVWRWWESFIQYGPKFTPADHLLPELTLSIPLGSFTLLGRFDLLVKKQQGEVHIYDWKTGQPKTAGQMRHNWQTKLYLALTYEGREALHLPHLSPAQIHIHYWYARQPEQLQTIHYTPAEHEKNWAEITQWGQKIAQQLEHPTWPLTSDLEECGRCHYRNYCGRFEATQLVERILEERDEWDELYSYDVDVLEPELE